MLSFELHKAVCLRVGLLRSDSKALCDAKNDIRDAHCVPSQGKHAGLSRSGEITDLWARDGRFGRAGLPSQLCVRWQRAYRVKDNN